MAIERAIIKIMKKMPKAVAIIKIMKKIPKAGATIKRRNFGQQKKLDLLNFKICPR